MLRSISICLALSLLPFAATACGSAEAKPAPAEPKQASTGDDLHPTCVALMTKSRDCTDVFIPALVDARASVDQPPGIADAVKQDRDGVIAKAKTEWASDSTDQHIDEHCNAMVSSLTDEQKQQLAPAKECLAKAACGEFVACAMPVFSKHLGK